MADEKNDDQPVVTTVHPFARWVAGLYSPMSLRDQDTMQWNLLRILYVCLFISFLCALVSEEVHLVLWGLLVGGIACLVVCGPNWLQREDVDQCWADEAEVQEYYKGRARLLEEIEAIFNAEGSGELIDELKEGENACETVS